MVDVVARAVGTLKPNIKCIAYADRTVGLDEDGYKAHVISGSHALDSDDAACSKQAAVLLPTGQRGLRVDDEAIDRYWDSIAP